MDLLYGITVSKGFRVNVIEKNGLLYGVTESNGLRVKLFDIVGYNRLTFSKEMCYRRLGLDVNMGVTVSKGFRVNIFHLNLSYGVTLISGLRVNLSDRQGYHSKFR